MAQDLFRLDGRTAFVSGARGHLGAAMAQAWPKRAPMSSSMAGMRALWRVSPAKLRARGLSAEPAAFDAHDVARIRSFFGGLKRLDVLVNNIGFMDMKSFAALEPEDFAATYAATVGTAFETVRAALPALKAAVASAGDASVINVSSMYGQVAPDRRLYDDPGQQSPFHYGPAKAGLEQLTRHLAAELGRENIRVNALVPGPFPKSGKMPPGLEERPGRPHHAGPHRPAGRNRRPAAVPGGAGLALCDRRQPECGWRLDGLVR